MFDHLSLRTARLDASIRFYEAALAPLGYQLASRDEQGAGLGPPGAPALWLARVTAGSSARVALNAPDRQAVDRYAAGARGRGRQQAPGPRPTHSLKPPRGRLPRPCGNNVKRSA